MSSEKRFVVMGDCCSGPGGVIKRSGEDPEAWRDPRVLAQEGA